MGGGSIPDTSQSLDLKRKLSLFFAAIVLCGIFVGSMVLVSMLYKNLFFASSLTTWPIVLEERLSLASLSSHV